jgi:AraC-like DNA-binding protein
MEQQSDVTLFAKTAVQKLNAFSVSHFEVQPGVTDIRSDNSYDVVFNGGSIIQFSPEHGDSGILTCPPAAILFILHPFSTKQVQFETSAKLFRMAVDPALMVEWFGSEKVDFTQEHNLSSPFLIQLLAALSSEISKGQIIEKRYAASIAMAVVNELYCQFRASGKKCFSPKGKLSSQQMKKVIDFVKSSLHSEIHLSSMANEVHLSDFHFSRLFRHTFGITPYQYVLQGKIEYAKTLLRHYPRSLSQIAHSLNFTDQSHFTNVFKKLTGICPSDFAMNRVKSAA